MIMETKGNKTMTDAEETRELRRWLREDSLKAEARASALHEKIDTVSRDLHRKIDSSTKDNQKEHKILEASISRIRTDGKVTATKLIGLAGLVSLMVTLITGHFV
jgi:hypothetical protein